MLGRWERANNSQRRAVITAVLEKVIVQPAVIDPDRLKPVWRS
jgi:hypothetical protein